jgi:hypothetical protein
MRDRHKRRRNAAGAAMFAFLLAACAATPLPYQARTGNEPAYGYADGKIDALHYSIVYTDKDRDQADRFLEMRAAEIARNAGFAYFAFDKRGTGTVKKTENQFQTEQPDQSVRRGQTANDYIPEAYSGAVNMYFSAAGEISLLTAEQALGNPKAIEVRQVLAKMSANIKS